MKYLSLFSGIGGFEYGLEQSKYHFECIGYSEIDKYAKSIYKRHFPKHIDLGDAREIRADELEDFDLLVGGFPCQAFSLSGKRKGFDDTRGTLFFEIARILKEKKPRYFLLENVKGLLSHNKGETFKKILGVLAELGYDVEWQVYNSKCFNTAQNRERLYLKGYSRRLCGGEILSVKRECREACISIDTVKSQYQSGRIMSADGCSCTLCGLGGGQGAKTGLYKVEGNTAKVSNKYWGNRTGRVHRTDEIMNALACSGHNGGSRQIIVDDRKHPLRVKTNTKKGYDEVTDGDGVRLCHPNSKLARGRSQKGQTGALSTSNDWGTVDTDYRIRRLTPRECEKLQAFPSDWTKYGADDEPISDTQRYKCLGNAVTTTVITHIADTMFNNGELK